MDLERPLLVRALGAIASIVFVAAVIGAFTVDDGNGGAKVAASDRTTTSTTGDVTSTSLDEGNPASDATSTTAATVSSVKATTTTKPSAPVADPGPAKPPAPGTYHYKFANPQDTSKNMDTTEVIESQPDQNGAARRKETYPDGQGNNLSNEVAYAADGVRVFASHIVSAQGTVDCTWNPPILEYAVPLSVNKTWSYDSKCTTTAAGAEVTVERKGDDKVTGKTVDLLGTTSVRTWVIEEHVITTVTSVFFSTKIDAMVTRHWSPDYGLVTFEHESGKNNSQEYVTERTLQSVKPS